MKNVLAYHCTVYLDAEKNETIDEAASRLERILKAEGIDHQFYDAELRNEEGQAIESK